MTHPPKGIEDMVLALSRHGQQLKQSGHNTIFAALALRALKDHPELATQKIVHGLKRLMQQFDQAPPGKGYFGKAQGWLTKSNHVGCVAEKNPFISMDQAIQEVMELCERGHPTSTGFWRLVSSHQPYSCPAVTAPHGMGKPMPIGLKTLQHLEYYLALPDLTDELGSLQRASVDPRQWSGWLT